MAMFDKNGDQKITMTEVHQTIGEYVDAEKAKILNETNQYIDQAAHEWEMELQKAYGEAFNMTDTDGNGEVTMTELVEAFQAQGYGLAQTHAKNMGAKKHLRIDYNKLAKMMGKKWDLFESQK